MIIGKLIMIPFREEEIAEIINQVDKEPARLDAKIDE